jgi:hypothetical protein
MTGNGARWEHDTRGTGVGDGRWIAAHVEQLGAALAVPGWVAESPEEHLLPHLERAVAAKSSPWRLTNTSMTDGLFEVTLEWDADVPRLRQLRVDAVRLIAEIAEGTTFIHQIIAEDAIEYHVVTGQLAESTAFVPHGHLIRLIVRGPAVPSLVAGAQVGLPSAGQGGD